MNEALRPDPPNTTHASQRLVEVVREAGLADRVRVGVPIPQPVGTPTPRAGTEEAFAPDAVLRPLVRAGQGRLIELAGAISSGRTSLAYRMAASATARGELVGWVDLPNALDPRSLLRAGADLRSVLWVRPAEVQAALRSTELLLKTGFAIVTLDLEGAPRRELGKLGPPIWTRLLRAVRESRSTALLLSPERLTGSFSTLSLHTHRDRARFESGLFEGLDCRTDVLRTREAGPETSYPFQVHHRPVLRSV